MAETRLSEIKKIRLDRRQALLDQGINPYPASLQKDETNTVADALDKKGETVSVRGRLMSFRAHGNITFADLRDQTGSIQLFFQKKDLEESYKLLRKLDIGDFLLATGEVFVTEAGETTVRVTEFQILVKAINPLPSTFHGLKDVEERYRKRYVDLIMNEEVRERLTARSKVITSLRRFLDERGFLEVETPTLQPVYGGGFAKPFSTHHNALDSEFYLRISDEMYLKRLIVGGFEKVYEITKVFRNEGVDHDHNPEFTMFEAQIAYEDYTYGMDIIEEIMEHVAKEVFGTTEFTYGDTTISFARPWKRMKVVEAIKEFTGINPLEWTSLEEAKNAAKNVSAIPSEKHKELDKALTIGEVIAFVFEEACEPKLIQPTIIYDYPKEISPLAKKCEDERFTQRFEMFAYGSELGNNYSELNDPVDLEQRFIHEKDREKAGFDEAHQTDYDYLEAINYGFPPTCGIAIGIDRFVMMLTNASNIREVIAFPTLKPINKEND